MQDVLISEGMRMFLRSIKVRVKGLKRYSGNDEGICRKAVEGCWNSRYFMTSSGHFCQFYTRDFGWCAESLINLGYKDKVQKTVNHALDSFRRHGKVAAAISPSGIPFDFPTYAVDSLPYLIKCLRLLGDKRILSDNAEFLNNEIRRFYELVVDKKTGLVKKRHFSSIKDHAIRQSSCYDNCMAAMLNDELNKIKVLENPLKGYDFKGIIKKNFWTGEYFLDDLSGSRHISGDAQIMPFYAGIFSDKAMLKKCIAKMQEEGLDRPFPLRYSRFRLKQEYVNASIFAKDYETNTVWAHLGMMLLEVLAKHDLRLCKKYMWQYKQVIERYGNFLEVYATDGKPYKSMFYYCDSGMLWASVYLNIKKNKLML